MTHFRIFGLIALLALSYNARGDTWGDFIASGTACNSSTVYPITNGNALSVLFSDFSVGMNEFSRFPDGLQARKTCNFRMKITPPRGYYLARLRQVFSGGIIKSANSSASLAIRFNIGTSVERPFPVVFPEGYSINPGDLDSVFEQEYDNFFTVASCGGGSIYGVNMSITAARRNYSEFLLAGVDSEDAEFTTQIKFIPEWRLCR